LYASCKKNQEEGTVQKAQASPGTAMPAKMPDAFKKEINVSDPAGKGTVTLLLASDDEQMLNTVAAGQFRIASRDGQLNIGEQQPVKVGSVPKETADPGKAVLVSVTGIPGNKGGGIAYTPSTASMNVLLVFSNSLQNNALMLRKNTVWSNFDFGVGKHTKFIGIGAQDFGNPWGTVGYPLRSGVTDQVGVLCNRLATSINLASVNGQVINFWPDAWPL
jgi:hypothetical protein